MQPDRIYWNADYETFEAVYPDGYILPLRDSVEAQKLAEEHGMEVEA